MNVYSVHVTWWAIDWFYLICLCVLKVLNSFLIIIYPVILFEDLKQNSNYIGLPAVCLNRRHFDQP